MITYPSSKPNGYFLDHLGIFSSLHPLGNRGGDFRFLNQIIPIRKGECYFVVDFVCFQPRSSCSFSVFYFLILKQVKNKRTIPRDLRLFFFFSQPLQKRRITHYIITVVTLFIFVKMLDGRNLWAFSRTGSLGMSFLTLPTEKPKEGCPWAFLVY